MVKKKSAGNAGIPGLIPEMGRSPGEGNGNPLQDSGLENPTDRGAWWATAHGVATYWTGLKPHVHKLGKQLENTRTAQAFTEKG